MPSVFEKLNWKGQTKIVVVNAPASFEPELAALRGVAVRRSADGPEGIEFFLAFVTKQPPIDQFARIIGEKAQGDAVVWFAYPKGSSKKYQSEINRDHGWQVMGNQGFEPVRMVAIDEDWSAVRFRRIEFIKQMKRADEHRLTKRAKQR